MSMEFVNRICPNCKSANYIVWVGDLYKAYKYECMNCNGYFNDIDFEKETLQPVLESECINSKVDMVEVVRCKDCKSNRCGGIYTGMVICYNTGAVHSPDWYCADGERK